MKKIGYALSVCLLAAGIAQAATISWDATATKISGDSDVSTNGDLVWAYNFGTTAATTVNGVTFTGVNTATATGITTDMTNGIASFAGSADEYAALSTAYKAMVAPGGYKTGTEGFYNLTGLTEGHTYEVQFWVNDSRSRESRGDFWFRQLTLDNSGDPAIVVDYNVTDTDSDVGQFIIGTFTADATGEQLISFTSSAPQLNAIQLRTTAIPEPATIGMLGLGALITLLIRKWQGI
jgi:hypothetical protein